MEQWKPKPKIIMESKKDDQNWFILTVAYGSKNK